MDRRHNRKPMPLLLLVFCSFALMIASVGVSAEDLAGDTRALEAFRSAVGGEHLRWTAGTNACTWSGVRCSRNRVVLLSLPAAGLLGRIPPLTLGNLTALRILRLRFNSLEGPLPSDLSRLTELRTLYLQENRLQGTLPQNLWDWTKLVRLNLDLNNFTGPLPSSLRSLRRLGTLRLQHNRFVGSLPDLDLPHLAQFNVSANNFSGEIPKSLRRFSSDSFLGNAGLCGSPLPPCGNSTGSGSVSKVRSRKAPVVLIVGISTAAGLAVCGCLMTVCWAITRRRKRRSSSGRFKAQKGLDGSTSREFDNSSSAFDSASGDKKLVFFSEQTKPFGLEDLLRASAEVLGRGSLGTSYKALLEVGSVVVVKRLKEVGVSAREFSQQMTLVGRLNHKNLLVLRAFYYSQQEKLLVSEYLPMGSLSSLLHGSRGSGHTLLDWAARIHIAQGGAEAIEYIHKHNAKLSHGNIKSSNILLTEDYSACVSDYALIQMCAPNSAVARKVGYRAPEVTDIRAVSHKADVYSFGVLLLEMLTGREPTQASLSEEGVDLPRWVQSVVKEEWTAEVFDLELTKQQPPPSEEEMVQLLQVAMSCVKDNSHQRPSMSEVVEMIRSIAPSRSVDE